MERVNTGGNVTFEYPKGYSPKLSPEEKQEFAEAYASVKRKERIWFWLVIILIAVLFALGIKYLG